MRGTVAKRLRRAVYGNQSLRGRDLSRQGRQLVADNVRQAYRRRKRRAVRREA